MVPDLNVRLSVVYSEIWLDAQRVDLHSDIERTLSGAQEYVAGHIYQVEKDATILFTGGYFGNNEMLTGSFASICTSRAVGIVKVSLFELFLSWFKFLASFPVTRAL